MTEQTEFPFGDQTEAETAAGLWMDENPEVMKMLRRFAREKEVKGLKFGMAALRERVRWECSFYFDPDDYKINNNHTPWIARRLIRDNRRLGELIETRKAGNE